MEISVFIDGREETFKSAEDAIKALQKEKGQDLVRKARIENISDAIRQRANMYAYDTEIDKLPEGDYRNKAIDAERIQSNKIQGAIKTIISARMGFKNNLNSWKHVLANDEEGKVLKCLDEIMPLHDLDGKINEVEHIKDEIRKLKTNIKDIK